MTCIVALINDNKVLLGGDAAASDDKSGLIFQRTDPKVFKVGQFGIGFVDSFRMGQILQYYWTPPVYKPTAPLLLVFYFLNNFATLLVIQFL